MKTVAIICEYNPFHNGHVFQINEIRRKIPDACIIALMSGEFVQRGDIAVFPKYERAKCAVMNGVDIVLQLPYPYSFQSAEYFAYAAVYSLKQIGIDYVCFGSECGDAEKLKRVADNCLSKDFREKLSERFRTGKNVSHAVIESELYEELFGSEFPKTANDILATEYIKQMRLLKYEPQLLCIKREAGFSAADARNAMFCHSADVNMLVPDTTADIAKKFSPVSLQSVDAYIMGTLRTSDPKVLSKYAENSGGLAARIVNMSQKAEGFEGLIKLCATKKYTNARIRRAVLNSLFGVTKRRLGMNPKYLNLLALNSKYGKILKDISSNGKIKIICRIADVKKSNDALKKQHAEEERAEKIAKLAYIYSGNGHTTTLEFPYIRK